MPLKVLAALLLVDIRQPTERGVEKMTTTRKMMRRTGVLFAATLLALVVFSGVALAATIACQAEVQCFGTKRADTLNGSEGKDFMAAKGRGDTLNGFGGYDLMNGQGGADKLFGGADNDVLDGGSGSDVLSGGEGLDSYYFGDGWGKDTISDSGPRESLLFIHYPESGPGVPVSDDLIIKLEPGAGPEVKNASATSTINWEGNLFNNEVWLGGGDDQLTGTAAENEIFGEFDGADTISTGAGNDYIDVHDGVGDDVVDCGETPNVIDDDDLVVSDTGDQIANNCERIQH
jgi:hypothetical protein